MTIPSAPKFLLRAAGFAWALSALSSNALAEGTVVVELYTSQGCSSCPAADAVLLDLKSQPDLIALSLNVDYWDYLGWKDDLALPGNTKRQRAYAKMLRSRHIYTPQMMIDGQADVVGSRRSQVDAAIARSRKQSEPSHVKAAIEGDIVHVTLSAAKKPPSKEAVVWLVGYDASVSRKIGGGENHGRSIEYGNVVREWREAARWDGTEPLSFTAKKPAGESGFVVIVQEGDVGPILCATRVAY